MAIISSNTVLLSSSIVAAAADDRPSRPHSPSLSNAHTLKQSRRNLLATSLSGAFLVATSFDTSIPEYPPKSQLIEQLLEKTRANKARNDQKRLDSYYERNFKEYFEFLEGTLQNKSELSETEKGILKWLERTRSKKK